MASPWNLLQRLTSWRRERNEQQGGLTNDVPPAEATGAPVAVTSGKARDSSDRLVEEKLQATRPADALVTMQDRSVEAASRVHRNVDLESTGFVDAPGPALPGTGELTAASMSDARMSASSRARSSGKRKRAKKPRASKADEPVPQLQTRAPSFSDEVRRLDEEIGLVRGQLAHKLQLQNAQLRTMLERFER